ncbi:uncharacterized protein Asalp_29670 [Aeromonas salmonicida subsp. pectinolytica 34mel]|uniref:Uncharacterized protein n=1 Tax=Aeromonas salmonicida subsp. pectinolytica 34mel TaxID=1324960 RepID=A0A2D1QII8_AERSA|nr:hypothetical protein O23A_p1036 [Aeromonas salmonicida]ATP10082.1 uncharacterized protein Asalp_29670 [Aeromonas salmonicida subsp. pectinolytica 34mel]
MILPVLFTQEINDLSEQNGECQGMTPWQVRHGGCALTFVLVMG